MTDKERRFVLPLAELIDRLTVDQIKEVLLEDGRASYADEMARLSHDMDLIIDEKSLGLSARLLRIVIALAQLNVHIWYHKDRMQEEPAHYDEHLRLAHQLNGIRNRLKNLLLEETGDRQKAAERSNFNTDGLQGWEISIE